MSRRVPYPKFGQGPGLERVSAIAAVLGVQLEAFGAAASVVVGSNGKGSTAAMTAALLQQKGQSVGLFTSPHLLDINERFRVDGDDIDDTALDHHWGRVSAAAERAGQAAQLGGFEFLFLIAADWFAARGCAFTVWEAGIGGRLDPVRVITGQNLALTSLDLEHTELLGSTLEAIALDKLDAAPAGARVFISESCAGQRAAIDQHCAARGLKQTWVGAHDAAPLAGAFQRQNAALAIGLGRAQAPLTEEQVSAGLAATRWPGRLEVLTAEPLVVIDVGHTPAGVRAALQGFDAMRGDREAVLVTGVSHDKDAAGMLAALAPAFGAIICASAHHKGAPAALVGEHAQRVNPQAEIILAESVADARSIALSKARGGAVYVAGGLFLAAEFKAAHLGRDPTRLGFF